MTASSWCTPLFQQRNHHLRSYLIRGLPFLPSILFLTKIHRPTTVNENMLALRCCYEYRILVLHPEIARVRSVHRWRLIAAVQQKPKLRTAGRSRLSAHSVRYNHWREKTSPSQRTGPLIHERKHAGCTRQISFTIQGYASFQWNGIIRSDPLSFANFGSHLQNGQRRIQHNKIT